VSLFENQKLVGFSPINKMAKKKIKYYTLLEEHKPKSFKNKNSKKVNSF